MQAHTMKRARVEIIPLIDVIFFLLATFVLFTLSLNRMSTIPLVLPGAGDKPPPPELVNLLVAPHGTLYWNDEPISRADLPARLAHYQGTTRDPRVFISGQETADFGDAVGVLDDVRAAGIKLVSLKTQAVPSHR